MGVWGNHLYTYHTSIYSVASFQVSSLLFSTPILENFYLHGEKFSFTQFLFMSWKIKHFRRSEKHRFKKEGQSAGGDILDAMYILLVHMSLTLPSVKKQCWYCGPQELMTLRSAWLLVTLCLHCKRHHGGRNWPSSSHLFAVTSV